MIIGLISDTHGVIDDNLRDLFRSVDLIVHAGDVGHQGGHEEVRRALESIAPTQCVRGNVDERAPTDQFPSSRLVEAAGWRIAVTHICGNPPSKEAIELVRGHKADILVFGHSHKPSVATLGNTLYINPGSAGPARFKLPRTVAILCLPEKASEGKPSVKHITLAQKAKTRKVRAEPAKANSKGSS